MNVPLGDDRAIEISPQTLNHWATFFLSGVIGLLVWLYQGERQDIADLRRTVDAGMQARLEITADVKAHEEGDVRTSEELKTVAAKQVEVLSRLSAIETHDGQTITEANSLSRRVDELEHTISQRIDAVDKATSETQRQLSAIEGKLGESLPSRH